MNEQMNFGFGEALRDEGVAAVTAAEHRAEWMENALMQTEHLVRSTGQVCADDLRFLSEPPHPNCVGAVFLTLSRRGIIRESGFRKKSRYASTHARKLTIWVAREDH